MGLPTDAVLSWELVALERENTRWGELWQAAGLGWVQCWADLIVSDRVSGQLQGKPFREAAWAVTDGITNSWYGGLWRGRMLRPATPSTEFRPTLLPSCPRLPLGRCGDVSCSCLVFVVFTHWAHFMKANSLWAI